jgi:hypothetical protein
MPVWIDAKGDGAFAETSGLLTKAGLKITQMRKTVPDTLAWHLTRAAAERDKLKSGISHEREVVAIAAWRSAGE